MPLAELWFGTHKNGPSTVVGKNKIQHLSEFLGELSPEAELPYLAKILSVDAPLSIQLHPPKAIAVELHAKDPKNYPDNNPKPEMSIALTKVELLCGVRRIEDISQSADAQPAFSLLGSEFNQLLAEGDLRRLTDCVFRLEREQLREFVRVVALSSSEDPWTKLAKKLVSLGAEVDSGFVYVYFLEYLELEPGEAIFIEPGIPHAYLYGEMFECMQSSDNVVRGGLTPKYIDRENFVRICSDVYYDPRLASVSNQEGIKVYKPLGCPFSVMHINSINKVRLDLVKNSILINVKGQASLILNQNCLEINDACSFFLPKDVNELDIHPAQFVEMFIVSPV